jgi:hypothetical protein
MGVRMKNSYDIIDILNAQYFDIDNTILACQIVATDGFEKLMFANTKILEGIDQTICFLIDQKKIKILDFSESFRIDTINNIIKNIESLRDKHNTGGVFALYHWWPTNLVTIPQWNYLRDMAREVKFDGGDMDAVMTDMDGNPFNWQTLDNGDIGLTANMVVTITNMGARNVNQNSQNAKRHITNLNASEHPEDYDYSDGWTDIYEG